MLTHRADGMRKHHLQRILHRIHNLLLTHDADMHVGNAGHEARIALIGLDDNGAGFGDPHVGAGHPDIRIQKNRPEIFAHDSHDGVDVLRHVLLRHLPEYLRHLRRGFVHRGEDQVKGFFLHLLNDQFTQVPSQLHPPPLPPEDGLPRSPRSSATWTSPRTWRRVPSQCPECMKSLRGRRWP